MRSKTEKDIAWRIAYGAATANNRIITIIMSYQRQKKRLARRTLTQAFGAKIRRKSKRSAPRRRQSGVSVCGGASGGTQASKENGVAYQRHRRINISIETPGGGAASWRARQQ